MSQSTWQDVIAWDSVDVPVGQCEFWVSQFQHRSTATLDDGSDGSQREGLTIWGATCLGRPVGISWRWATRGYQVIAIADPMRIQSNIRWLFADGHEVSGEQTIVLLNELVHGLPWQSEVLKASRQPRRRLDVLAALSASERRGL